MAKVKEVVTTELHGKPAKAVKLTDGTLVFKPDDDIEELLYTAFAEKFVNGKTNQKTWIAQFVDQQMDSLKQSLKKDPYVALSTTREVNKIVTNTQSYFNTKKQTDSDFSEYLLKKMLFPWQQKVFESNAKKKTMCCGRRSGKTFNVVQQALKECLKGPIICPDGTKKPRIAAIIGLTVEKTANLYWENIKSAIEKCHINTTKIDNSCYTVYFSNGSILQLLGNNSKAEREKIRGADYCFVAIDECQSQAGMYYLCEDILKPILKGTDGILVLLGTGPISAGGYWEKCLNDDSFEHFHATMEDNPTIPNYEHALEDVLIENHWDRNNITFRREYLGEIAYDTERMIIPKRSYYKELPKDFHPTKCYIGVDYGWSDFSSFAPILIDEAKRVGYVVHEWKANKTSSQALVDKMKALNETIHSKYNIPVEDIHIVADSSHQQISQDIYNQGIINIQNAYKLDEQYQWARLSEACACEELFILENGEIDKESDAVVWKWNQEKGCVIYQVDDDTYHPDILDSLKYAWNQYVTDRNAS